MTIHDVKRSAEAKGSFFFTKNNMKFFGDTLKTLGVKTIGGEIFVYRKKGRKAIWQFNPETGNFLSVTDQMSSKIY